MRRVFHVKLQISISVIYCDQIAINQRQSLASCMCALKVLLLRIYEHHEESELEKRNSVWLIFSFWVRRFSCLYIEFSSS